MPKRFLSIRHLSLLIMAAAMADPVKPAAEQAARGSLPLVHAHRGLSSGVSGTHVLTLSDYYETVSDAQCCVSNGAEDGRLRLPTEPGLHRAALRPGQGRIFGRRSAGGGCVPRGGAIKVRLGASFTGVSAVSADHREFLDLLAEAG